MDEANETNKDEVQEFINRCHLTLTYLWVMCKGLNKEVVMLNPPELDTVDKEGSFLIDHLKEKDNRSQQQKKKQKQKQKSSKSSKKSRWLGESREGVSVTSGKKTTGLN
jgi:hypothetical protein